MSDCSNHTKEVAGISDMKQLAEMIGDLHYRVLIKLFKHLSEKLLDDAKKDVDGRRKKLAIALIKAASYINLAKAEIKTAWRISRFFMSNKIQNHE